MISRTALRASRQAAQRFSAVQRPSSSPFLQRQIPDLQAAARPQRVAGVRWYSDAAPEAAKKQEGETEKPSDATAKELEAIKQQVEKKDKEIVDLKDKYLRSVADFRNLQLQTQREVQAAKDFALQRFAKDLIESVDNLDRALMNVPADKLSPENHDLVMLHDGLKMTERILMDTLKKHGLERFDPSAEGLKFDPNIHEAVFMTPQPDKEDGTVFHTQQKGFKLNGRVLRAAKVGVVKNQ